ncbi:MAG: hypothetical protein KGI70_00885 [Patescibacteria group bacterium]|nr:hypothetical protein [Patescibacteria group bacterium]
MSKFILPIMLVAAGVGLFILWTSPQYATAQGIKNQTAAYDDALAKSAELKGLRDQLLSKYNTFSTDDIKKLTRVLPDNVDNIRLIIDINNIASRHNLTLKNVQLGAVSDSSQSRSATAVGSSGDPVGSVQVGFAVNASYDDMITFVTDLEHSLRLIDIQKLDFNAPSDNGPTTDYTFTIRTYWLH